MAAANRFDNFQLYLKDYFNKDLFSDAVVRCNKQEFRVHKVILSAHSSFFAKALSNHWKESSDEVIELKEVDSNVVEAMLRFMYSFDYNNVDGASTMIFDAKVYSIADRYDVPALKEHAKDKFKTAIASGWSMDDFPMAITEVYSSTPELDRGLRDLVIEKCGAQIDKLLGSNLFCDSLRQMPGFAADMVLFRCGEGNSSAYKCPSCNGEIYGTYLDAGSYYCSRCGAKRSDWKTYKVKK